MSYLVFKRGEFWRQRATLRLREVRVFRFWKFKRVISNERYVKKSRVLVLAGGKGVGKSRELVKFFTNCHEVYGAEGVFIPCAESLENWFKRAGLSQEELKGLRQFEKVRLLIERCKGKVVFLDDVDKVDSKVKLEALKWLIRVSKAVVVSCENIHKVNDSVEAELRKKLRLRAWHGWGDYIIDLGRSEVEVKDVGMIVAIVLIVFVAFVWGLTAGLLGALAFRYLVAEGRRA